LRTGIAGSGKPKGFPFIVHVGPAVQKDKDKQGSEVCQWRVCAVCAAMFFWFSFERGMKGRASGFRVCHETSQAC
jgi:hypothetical protein